MLPGMIDAKQVEPHEDYGFFGPGSVTWKVWSYPTSLTVGFQRAVVVEELDPALIAAVDASGDVRSRPRTRYDRTLRYFATIAFGGSGAALAASNILVKVHAKAVGTEPLSGNTYDANAPHSQLWIHLTAWHSILKAYEVYGPGRLTPEEEGRYWQECAIAAELQTCDIADVPLSRDGIHQYFTYMRPRLAGSEAAQSMMDHLLNAQVMMPEAPRPLKLVQWVAAQVLRRGTIATMPRWMRQLGGIRQSRLTDALVRPALRIAFKLGDSDPHVGLLLLGQLSPSTVAVAAPILLGIPPRNQRTFTPGEARERDGILTPSAEYARFRELVERRRAQGARTEAELGVGPELEEAQLLLGRV